MFILRRTYVQTEVVKWAILLAIATMVALLLATRMAGAGDTPHPLPGDINTWAKPIPETADPPFFPEVGPPLRTNDQYRIVWRILRLHRIGQVEEAIATWQRAELAPGKEVWRNIALGAANLQAGALDAAEEQLDAALKMEPRNAVAHYYVGLLRLAQAGQAPNWWPDMLTPPQVALIALPPIVPNTRDMYELDALQELQNAIDLAPEMNLDAALVLDPEAIGEDRYVPMITPTVRDLLEALGADRYPARAHDLLGQMQTRQGKFEQAEQHLDAAAAEHLNTPLAYRRLAEGLAANHQYEAAARVYQKAFRNGDVNLIPALRMIMNGWKAATGN
jgi:tetratricopeptide (TPR) repeat protein